MRLPSRKNHAKTQIIKQPADIKVVPYSCKVVKKKKKHADNNYREPSIDLDTNTIYFRR